MVTVESGHKMRHGKSYRRGLHSTQDVTGKHRIPQLARSVNKNLLAPSVNKNLLAPRKITVDI